MLGQNQECYGACFSPSQSLDGTLAAVRVWNTVRTAVCLLLPLHDVPVNPLLRLSGGPCPLGAFFAYRGHSDSCGAHVKECPLWQSARVRQ